MSKFDLAKIKTDLKTAFDDTYGVGDFEVTEITYHDKPAVKISIDRMYDYSSITEKFSYMQKVSEVIGCKEIDSDQWCDSEGCETCGHGSSYITELYCWKFDE